MTDRDPWDVVERCVEYDCPWYTGGYDRIVLPDGSERRYYWVDFAPAALVIAVDDGDLVLVEQYRPAVGERHVELPAGMVEDGESYVEAGVRELEEETGYRAGDAWLVEEYATATGVLRHDRGVVAATDLTETSRNLDSDEYVDVCRVSTEEALDVARQQPANDLLLTGVLLAREEGLL